jgi:GT2 family glycosyltransferase
MQSLSFQLPTVVIIGVSYRTDALAVRFARSTAALTYGGQVTTIMVDNSEIGSREALRTALLRVNPTLRYVQAPQNLGYFGGAALGLRSFAAEHGWPDWVIVSNVDVEFRQPNVLELLAQGPWAADVGIVAPSIWSSKSFRDLNPWLVRRPAAARMRFYKVVFSNVYTLNAYEILAAAKPALRYAAIKAASVVRSLGHQQRSASEVPDGRPRQRIYAPHGSCLLFARAYFDRGGTLDYPQFLFGEEIYVAETVRALGLQVVYEPRLRVWHDDHASTGLIRSRFVARHVSASARFIADQYFA